MGDIVFDTRIYWFLYDRADTQHHQRPERRVFERPATAAFNSREQRAGRDRSDSRKRSGQERKIAMDARLEGISQPRGNKKNSFQEFSYSRMNHPKGKKKKKIRETGRSGPVREGMKTGVTAEGGEWS